jgi:predicted nucleotidyltransferase
VKPDWLDERTIYLTRHGSQAYGTALPTSDTDVKGVAIAPPEFYLGFTRTFEQHDAHEPDVVVFELRKFMRLAAECNPSIIEVLFTSPEDHLKVTAAGEELLAARGWFLSRRARQSFAGYAWAQLKRMQTHADPKALKLGMHGVRVLRMCREILETGQVVVKRPDREELLAIRAGAWSSEKLLAWAEAEDRALDEVCARSPLPEAPDVARIDALCVKLVGDSIRAP